MLGYPGLAGAQARDKIVLGQSAAFSGPAAQLGIQFHKGAKVWFDRVNAQGGVDGVPIEISYLDDGYEPNRCLVNTQKLIDSGVFALFGYVGTPTSLAVLPLAIKSKIPFLMPFTGAMGLREPFSRYVFHLRASYMDETALIVKQLAVLELRKVAVFYQNDPYGKAGLDGVNQALSARGARPVALGTVERNSVDVGAALDVILAASPDAIVQIGAYKACAAFIRAARRRGFTGTFFNVSFVGTQALADELGHEAAGVFISQVVPSPYNLAQPIARELVDSMKSLGGGAHANYSSMEGYLAAKVVTEGLRRTSGKALSRTALIQGLESMRDVSLGGFNVRYSSTGHVASHFVELSKLTGDARMVI